MGMIVVILFILNLLTIFAVVLLFQRQNRLIELERSQQKGLQESEELLSAFMMEMKEENELFLAKIRSVQEKDRGSASSNEQKPLEPENQEPELQIPQAGYQKMMAARAYKPAEKADPVFEDLPFEDQVFLLAEEGMPVEEIAKKLHKGKTEIELLLKFRKR